MSIKTALVVDDSRVARLTLTKLLKERSIEVEQANSAQEALGYLKKHHPDVVFMDYLMPDMNGLEATRLISTNPVTATIPVVICSAEETAGIALQAENHGAWGFLTKPAPEERLNQLLEKVSQKAPITQSPMPAPAISANTITLQDVERKAMETAESLWRRSAADMVRGVVEESVRSLFETQRSAFEQSILEVAKKSARETAESVAEISAKTIARQVAQEVAGDVGAKAGHTAAETVVRRQIKQSAEQTIAAVRHELDVRFDEVIDSGAQREELIQAAKAAAVQVAESVTKDVAHTAVVEIMRTQQQHMNVEKGRAEGQINAVVEEIKAEAQRTISLAKKLLVASGVVLMVSMGSTILLFLR